MKSLNSKIRPNDSDLLQTGVVLVVFIVFVFVLVLVFVFVLVVLVNRPSKYGGGKRAPSRRKGKGEGPTIIETPSNNDNYKPPSGMLLLFVIL